MLEKAPSAGIKTSTDSQQWWSRFGLGMHDKITKHRGDEEKHLNVSCRIKLLCKQFPRSTEQLATDTRNQQENLQTATVHLVHLRAVHACPECDIILCIRTEDSKAKVKI